MLTSVLRFRHLLPAACLILTACSLTRPASTPGPSHDAPQWLTHQQQIARIHAFQTRGAFAYLSDDQKVYARFNWQQTADDRYRLLLTSPLGSTALDMTVTPDNVILTDSNGKRYMSTDAEEMIARLTGMPVPLNNLRSWIVGLPGDARDYTLDDQYRLSEVRYTEAGKKWVVRYNGYNTDVHPAMPENMELREANLRIKLKMDHWTVTP